MSRVFKLPLIVKKVYYQFLYYFDRNILLFMWLPAKIKLRSHYPSPLNPRPPPWPIHFRSHNVSDIARFYKNRSNHTSLIRKSIELKESSYQKVSVKCFISHFLAQLKNRVTSDIKAKILSIPPFGNGADNLIYYLHFVLYHFSNRGYFCLILGRDKPVWTGVSALGARELFRVRVGTKF